MRGVLKAWYILYATFCLAFRDSRRDCLAPTTSHPTQWVLCTASWLIPVPGNHCVVFDSVTERREHQRTADSQHWHIVGHVGSLFIHQECPHVLLGCSCLQVQLEPPEPAFCFFFFLSVRWRNYSIKVNKGYFRIFHKIMRKYVKLCHAFLNK